jgi:hypothetical protein
MNCRREGCSQASNLCGSNSGRVELRSVSGVSKSRSGCKLTGYTGKQLSSETLDLAVGKRHKVIGLEEVKDTLSQQIHDDADVTSIIEAVS